LLFQAGLRFNVKKCNRGGKLRYWLQRMSAIVLLLFLGYHLLTLRDYRPTTDATLKEAAVSAAAGVEHGRAALVGSARGFQAAWPRNAPLYPLRLLAIAGLLAGTWAAVYHLSNGLWSAAIAWGIVETPASQRRWEWVCLSAGVALATLGAMGWFAFTATPGG
jgi:succinate dehydrogenase / fumarate reductase cytochrome b subunit